MPIRGTTMRAVKASGCFAISLIAATSWAAASPAPTLCNADELVIFSCATGARVASICASKSLSKTDGYMQYRFGRNENVELSYPELGAKSVDIYTSGTMMFSGGGGAWLRFKKGPFSYTIFTATGKWGSSGSPLGVGGVAVQKDGKEFANFRCRADPTSEIGPDLFQKLGLNSDSASEDFDIPDAFLRK